MIEILSSGALNAVQDLGRHGHLNIGVSRSGAMDSLALSSANLLVGNDEAAAGIEVNLFPFRLRFQSETRFACTGADALLKLEGRVMAPWWSRTARAGQTLVIEPPRRGVRSYLAFAGGIDVPLVMGSRSTDLKSGFGGLEGRGFRRGDVLPLGRDANALVPRHAVGILPRDLGAFWRELSERCMTIRVLPAAEYEQFSDSARAAFGTVAYEVTRESNRMGYRLAGEPLALKQALELFSHGIVPGTVQVPPSGQPIIQLAEANTCGGYPKIATIIEADLWRLAQASVGSRVRFEVVQADVALAALRQQAQERTTLGRNLALAAMRR